MSKETARRLASASPVPSDRWSSAGWPRGAPVAALVLAAGAMGTWGSVRMSRWDHAYAAS
ncbi:hypothetical protein AB0H18_09175 [Streptomyces sp. NPDC020766]|uniref:hypothetical protein n=1 Tax=Streptomyces sp. NPDC020766 TaxID=3155011 RepID=UPI0033FE112F